MWQVKEALQLCEWGRSGSIILTLVDGVLKSHSLTVLSNDDERKPSSVGDTSSEITLGDVSLAIWWCFVHLPFLVSTKVL